MKETEKSISEMNEAELMEGCSESQLAFVEEYFINGFNATEAYLKTNRTKKRTTAQVEANRVLTYPKIREIISRRMQDKAIAANEALARLGAIARGDIGDFLEITDAGTVEISLKLAKRYGLTHLIKRVKQNKRTEKNKEGETVHYVETTLELYSAQDAIRDILKVHGLFKESIDLNVSGTVGVLKVGENIDADEWAQSVSKYMNGLQSRLN